MAKMFINYRREDSGPYVDRLHDHLEQLFKEGEVFRDVYSIAPGEDFKEALETGIEAYDYVLVVIGPNWTSELKKRGTRNVTDYVRLEIETALRLDKKVIPVLVGGAQLPKKSELPKALKEVLDKQSFELSNSHFKEDVTRLVDAMGGGWGLFDLTFELPLAWKTVVRNELYLIVELDGGDENQSWEINSWGMIRKTGVDQISREAMAPLFKGLGITELESSSVKRKNPSFGPLTFRHLKIKPGEYSLKITLKNRSLRFLKAGRLQLTSKSKSFKVLIGGTYRFKVTVTMESLGYQNTVHRMELEQL